MKKSGKNKSVPSTPAKSTPEQHTLPHGHGYALRTRLIHGRSRTPKWDYSHHVVPPMTSSATFRLSSTQRGAKGFFEFACDTIDTQRAVPIYIYDRLDEPTRGMLEENLALAEGGASGVCFATGMAAITAAINALVRAGEAVLAHDLLYGCTYSFMTNWLPRQGVEAHFVNMTDLAQIRRNIHPSTRLLYFESPVNPTLELVDLRAVAELVAEMNRRRAEKDRIWTIVDNTFATPFCQRPIEQGIDIVVNSLTKGIGGFGTDMGGVVIAPESLHNTLMFYRKDYGGVLSPKAAWNVLVYGLPSLAARMTQMQGTAKRVAAFLEGHPKIAHVNYPGLASFAQKSLAQRQMRDYRGEFAPGSMIYFTVRGRKGSHHAAERFVDYVAEHAYCITLAVSLGQVKTLIENPYSMTHSSYQAAPAGLEAPPAHPRGLEPGGIRLSIGLEDPDDIVSDLEKALGKV